MASPIGLRFSAATALFLGLTLIATYPIVLAPASYAFSPTRMRSSTCGSWRGTRMRSPTVR